MDRKTHSRLIVLAGVTVAALAWVLDSIVDYLTGPSDATFLEMVVSPPLHAVFARTMLVITVVAVSYASSSVVALLDRRRARIEHLNSALRSIHAVNQLVARERDAGTLLRKTCALLASGQGYDSAWIVTLGDRGEVSDFFSDGLGDTRDALESMIYCGDFPPCLRRAIESGGVVIMTGDDCGDCPAASAQPQNARVVAPIRHGDRLEGYLRVSLPQEMADREEEAHLIDEIANDLAMGLHGIRTERELARRDALLAEAERMASLGAWRWDLDEDALHFSEEWGRIHGVDGDVLARRDFLSICHPDDRDAVASVLDAALRGEGTYSIERRIVRQTDGAVRWIDAQGEAVKNAEGEVVAFFGAAQDITERKLAEQRLRESRAELEAIYANAPVLLLLVDSDRHVRKMNRFAASVAGDEPDELVGLCGGEAIRCLHHLDDPRGCGYGQACEDCVVRSTVLDTFETGRRHHQVEATLPILTDGEAQPMTFLLSTALLDHRETPLVLVTMEDITDRKNAEQEVRELSRFREAVIDQANTAVVVFSPETRTVVWNRAVEEMTGYPAEEVMGRDAWVRILGKQRAEEIRGLLQDLIDRGGEIRDVETKVRAADGTARLLSWDARMLQDDAGQPLGVVAMGRDITEQRELERKLEQSQRMEAIGRLAGGVAHDFNNMLTAIIGNTELLECELDDPEIRDQLRDIKHAGERSAALTRQLLTFSRRARIEPVVFDLNTVVAEMQSMLERMIREHISLELALDPRGAPVRADRSQIEQVVMNLVINARDAMPDGGTIRVETSRVYIGPERAAASSMVEPGEHICLKVSDTGCGMDEETRARVFEPFFTTREEGTGLGLATVYGITQESRGEIAIESEPGVGTTVMICLPLTDDEFETVHETGEKPDISARVGARVLLAEDEAQVRGLVESILRTAGYEAISAESGEAALEALASAGFPVDVLLTDVVMGGMGGVELASRVRQQYPDLPVLFMSGYMEVELPRGARLLEKPFMPDELLEALREVLDASAG